GSHDWLNRSETVTFWQVGTCSPRNRQPLCCPRKKQEQIDALIRCLVAMETTVHTKEEIHERLRHVGPELRELGVERLGLFGSFLRGDSHDGSDIDLLVEFAPGRKSFDSFMNVSFRLEDILRRHVELVTKESLSRHIEPSILQEAEYVSLAGWLSATHSGRDPVHPPRSCRTHFGQPIPKSNGGR
ncbi:MAG: nucleotidyltransferase family protein, partial [Candidatus Paceibacterota bacterium]